MSDTSRRTLIAAAGAAAAGAGVQTAAQAASAPSSTQIADSDLAALVARSHEANAALMRGDIDTYMRLITLTKDFSFMGPFGGPPSLAATFTEDRMRAMGRFFRNGTLETELIEAYATPELAVLAVVERAHVEVGGLPAQGWTLRVTLVYRREAGEWRLAHRHADPLTPGISLAEAAALTARAPLS